MNKKLKKLLEQRAEKQAEMKALLDSAEERALDENETAQFDALEQEIKDIDKQVGVLQRALDALSQPDNGGEGGAEPTAEERAEAETRAFDAYLRGELDERAVANMTAGDNGAVIPTTIINKIIDKVKDISPVFSLSTTYNIGGTIQIPYVDDSTKSITVAFAEDFKELESSAANIQSISLSGYLAGVLSLVGKSLLNNSNFNLVDFVITKMAEEIAKWLENVLLNGSAKVEGLKGVTQSVTAAAAKTITIDELIDLQETIPDVYQAGAVWIMNRQTRAAIRKLKDADGRLLLNPDATAQWGYTLLGHPVYCSDNMAVPAAGATAVLYGDFSGLAVKITESASIEVLREKYATQHAIGVVAYLEVDSKVENAQKIAKLVMKSA